MMKTKLILGKYLTIFHKTDSGYYAESPDIPGLRVTGQTLEETESLIEKTVSEYTQMNVRLVSDSNEAIKANKLWNEIVEPALKQLKRNAIKKGWIVDTFINKRIFNQINRFNRSSSIRTTHPDETVRKLTIGWRQGSDAFSYGNTLAVTGWKNIKHSELNFDSLSQDLTDRLLS